jgi:benzil reductase ((S)-benzoin forming)
MEAVPYADARVIGVARRAPEAGEHLGADLSLPSSWDSVIDSFHEVLASERPGRAVFAHFAGTGAPHGPSSEADPAEFRRSVLLNTSGLILGQAFLSICSQAGVPAVLVVCSSPAALATHRGMGHYGAVKSALLHWSEVARDEESSGPNQFLSVIPWATDTPMLRDALSQDPDQNPLSGELRLAYERGEVASAVSVATAIWEAVEAGCPESPLHVGFRPDMASA